MEQSERLLGQVIRGVRLETATAALGISDLELLARLQSDAAFQVSLELATQVSSSYARVLLELRAGP